MSLEEFTAEGIRKLNKFGRKNPTNTNQPLEKQKEAKKIIERKLPPEEVKRGVYMPYVRNVLCALEYMEKNGLTLDDLNV